MSGQARFEIYEDEARRNEDLGYSEWRWRLRAANGEIVASGEGYTREGDARRGIEAVVDAVLGATTSAGPTVERGEA